MFSRIFIDTGIRFPVPFPLIVNTVHVPSWMRGIVFIIFFLSDQIGDFEDAFVEACFKSYIVTLRIKAEMVSDELKLKHTIQRMAPVDVKTECEALLSAISKYN